MFPSYLCFNTFLVSFQQTTYCHVGSTGLCIACADPERFVMRGPTFFLVDEGRIQMSL